MALDETPCVDCPPALEPLGDTEVVYRFEMPDGTFRSYAVDYAVFSRMLAEVFPTFMTALPRLLRPLAEGVMFSLRHGILQNLAKKQEVDADAILKAPGDKDGRAAQLAAYLAFDHVRSETVRLHATPTLDMTQRDVAAIYGGTVRRVPTYDALPAALNAPQPPDGHAAHGSGGPTGGESL